MPPADLTADHILEHPVGDLFWWVTAGIPESGMPAFGETLSTEERWHLVNWVRTLPIGGLKEGLTSEIVETAAPRAPDFTFERDDGSQDSLQDRLAEGPLLLVFFSSPDSLPRLDQLTASQPILAQAGLGILALPLAGTGDGEIPAGGMVAHADPSVAETYSVIATARRDQAQSPRHLEFLIDRAGYLRALWQPGDAGGWQDPAQLVPAARRLAEQPIAPVAGPAHVH